MTACCAVGGNECVYCTNCCIDHTASSDFLFRLQPGEPERFLPKGGTGGDATSYQWVGPDRWPAWGRSDLGMGWDNGPPGNHGGCSLGATYAGSGTEACGGYSTWGPTDLEVWFLKAGRGPEGR